LEKESIQRIKGMLGFARRAGKTVIGFDLSARALARGEARLLLTASDASDATKKRVGTKCEFYRTESVTVDISGEELGALLGKSGAVMVVAVTDKGFADEILKCTK
jgi:ribosomal protein L7Ae-like RNA K-turn-binding protein